MKKTIDKFSQKYSATVKPSTRRYYHTTPLPVRVNDEFIPVNFETEAGVDITMSRPDFQHLLEILGAIEKRLDKELQNTQTGLALRIVREAEREIKLRNHYPQLKELYEQYQTLLRMVDDGRD